MYIYHQPKPLLGNLYNYSYHEFLFSYNIVHLAVNALTHCGLVTADGDRYLDQHWLRQSLAITWTNVDRSTVKSIGIHLRAISQKIPQPAIIKISLNINYLNFHSNPPCSNELKPLYRREIVAETPLKYPSVIHHDNTKIVRSRVTSWWTPQVIDIIWDKLAKYDSYSRILRIEWWWWCPMRIISPLATLCTENPPSRLIVVYWRQMARDIFVNIISGNGLSPVRRQAIAWTSADLY